MSQSALRALDPDAFRAPGEKLALAMTLAVVGLVIFILTDVTSGGVIVGILIAALFVKVAQSQYLGSCIRVSPSQFPDIHSLARLAAERLAMPVPDIFITQDPV